MSKFSNCFNISKSGESGLLGTTGRSIPATSPLFNIIWLYAVGIILEPPIVALFQSRFPLIVDSVASYIVVPAPIFSPLGF